MEKLKQKVASSSSRVIASLQQAATGTFQAQQQQQQQQSQQQQQQQQQQAPPTSGRTPSDANRQAAQASAAPGSSARLIAADATAHLTEAEREILLQVFKKEEQFQRDTIKQMSASRASQVQQQQQQQPAEFATSDDNSKQHLSSRRQVAAESSLSGAQQRRSPANSNSAQARRPATRSATPLGNLRPSSAAGGGGGCASSSPSLTSGPLRTLSSCSSNTLTSATSNEPMGQCRICRKQIQANESCHLCSTCNQFICEDCASYSANEKHWMCSSCRRRATKPAISDDALKELGLNQNSSAVRRMTQRLNKNEIQAALSGRAARVALGVTSAVGSSSNESNSTTCSSNSSSGCSSMSTATGGLAGASLRALREAPAADKAPSKQSASAAPHQRLQRRQSSQPSFKQIGGQPQLRPQPQPQSQSQSQSQSQPRADEQANSSRLQQPQAELNLEASDKARGGQRDSAAQPAYNEQQQAAQLRSLRPGPPTESARGGAAGRLEAAKQQLAQATAAGHRLNQQQFENRRASVAAGGELASMMYGGGGVPGGVGRHHFGAGSFAQQAPARTAHLTRKQSTAFFTQNSVDFQRVSLQQAAFFATANRQAAAREQQYAQQLLNQQQQQQQQQPQTLITAAASDACLAEAQLQSRRGSQQAQQLMAQYAQQQQPQTNLGTTLIPIPPGQIHLRRLSDQSNLERRGSVIADTLGLEGLAMVRNRSHSNIDTLDYSNFFYQSALAQQQAYSSMGYAADNAQQQHDQRWPQEHEPINYAGEFIQQQQQQQPAQLSSIITPYAQKSSAVRRRSSEEIRSDSSSDIEEDQRALQTDFSELDNEQPNEYFAPPRALQPYGEHDASALNPFAIDNATANMAIPSVQVYEFRSSQQRLHQQQQLQLQLQQQNFNEDQILTTPMQINVAIEQAIKQQQQQLDSGAPSGGADFHHLLSAQSANLRRGSNGRVLPRVPGEQSRSLLELPRNGGSAVALNQVTGSMADSNGYLNGQVQQGFNMLGLPCVSPTVRRASAPEGQNIKIVVDDMDSSMMMMRAGTISGQNGSAGKQARQVYGRQGELYERLVLYRDDSHDPTTNMTRGFGLQVAGGKIDADEKLQAYVTWVLPCGPADKVGVKPGDRIIEWDGKCLVNMSYEQVADVIESSANIAELVIKPAQRLELQPGAANYVRSGRRLSQQTERDLKRVAQESAVAPNALHQMRASGEWLAGQAQEGGFKQAAADSAAASSFARVGTGRRLPQIPGLQLSTTKLAVDSLGPPGVDLKYNSSSTGQLETRRQSGATDYLSSTNRSAGDVGQLMQNGASLNALNTLSGPNSTWQQQHHQQQQQQQAAPFELSQLQRHQPHQAHQQLNNNYSLGLAAPADEIWGLIGLQVNVDERMAQLEISVLSAINSKLDMNLDYYVRVRILPESNHFKAFTTSPSSDLNWKETFLFQNFPIQQISKMALEIGIWVHDEAARLSTQLAQPVCEALISIQSARERNTDFWPLRAPPGSPQTRRKSLNDLIADQSHSRQEQALHSGQESGQLSIGYQPSQWQTAPMQQQANFNAAFERRQVQQMHQLQAGVYDNTNKHSVQQQQMRERSASNRNLPDSSKLRVQPLRRASDEVAGGSSCRVMARVSPASSRRSISVMNVGVGDSSSRPNSRLGSQSNILKLHRDTTNLAQQQANQTTGSPVSKYAPESFAAQPSNPEPTPEVGLTPSGRRSSLVGIQSMAGYRSQRSSNSNPSSGEQKSPVTGTKSSSSASAPKTRSQTTTPQQSNLLGGANRSGIESQIQSKSQQHRASVASVSASQTPPITSNAGSRRGSTERSATPQLQRKGSFAMNTLRKLKRTMSLTKGDTDQAGSVQGSRQSSFSSDESAVDLAEDLAVTRRIVGYTDFVGKLKLSFIMTKGQLEVDVIAAQGLKLEQDSSLGLYVKMYLKGKNKSNKRKTRLVQCGDSPVFKQVIKYDGSLVDNKSLEVSVWQKQGGLKGKMPLGFTEIRLSELSLNQLQTAWYNLRSMDFVCSSSVEDN